MSGITRLSPPVRRTLQIVGPIMVVAGFGLFALQWFSMASFDLDPRSNGGLPSTWAGFVGVTLLGVGGMVCSIAYRRAMTGIAVTEAEPAIEHGSAAIGRGLAKGMGTTKAETVRVRCLHCGGLDSEDAAFCSSCGKRMRPIRA